MDHYTAAHLLRSLILETHNPMYFDALDFLLHEHRETLAQFNEAQRDLIAIERTDQYPNVQAGKSQIGGGK